MSRESEDADDDSVETGDSEVSSTEDELAEQQTEDSFGVPPGRQWVTKAADMAKGKHQAFRLLAEGWRPQGPYSRASQPGIVYLHMVSPENGHMVYRMGKHLDEEAAKLIVDAYARKQLKSTPQLTEQPAATLSAFPRPRKPGGIKDADNPNDPAFPFLMQKDSSRPAIHYLIEQG